MIFIPVAFLAASIVSLAKPVSYDSSDLNSDETWVGIGGNDDLMSSTIPVLQRASTSDKQDDLTLSPGTSMTTNSMIEADSSNAYCSSDGFLNLDALHNLHTRNVVPRQSCSSDIKIPTRNPVKTDGSNAPLINLGSMDQPDHACPYQPHLEKQRLIHVTCGGPTVGDSFTEPDQVINCVPGVADVIEQRHIFHRADRLAQYCCHEFRNRPVWFLGVECSYLPRPPFRFLMKISPWEFNRRLQLVEEVYKKQQGQDHD